MTGYYTYLVSINGSDETEIRSLKKLCDYLMENGLPEKVQSTHKQTFGKMIYLKSFILREFAHGGYQCNHTSKFSFVGIDVKIKRVFHERTW